MSKIAVGLIVVFLSGTAIAQRKGTRMMKPPKATVCYASGKMEFANIGPPAEYLNAVKAGPAARTKSANIEVTYEGFSSEARTAFQAAVDIWEAILETPVTIHIHARWTVLGQNILGSAGPGVYVNDVEGLQKAGVWYPIALAEKIVGRDLNDPRSPDIVASFNSTNIDWHYEVDSTPAANEYDLMSIVLHEIGHGLGITHAYAVNMSGTLGFIPDFFEGMPVIFETSIYNGDQDNLVNDFRPPAAVLKSILTSNNLFYSSAFLKAANLNRDAVIYAPLQYNAGSSIAHLNETTYPAGHINSLMTPQIGTAERILDPGPIVKAILADMGWTGMVLKHTPLKNTESTTGPYRAVVKIANADGYDPNSVALTYKTVDQSFTSLLMTPTGNPDEFAANLPVGSNTYSYFISVIHDDQRKFTNPWTRITPGSQPSQELIVFSAGPDTEPPVINHTPKEFLAVVDGLQLEAIVSDNMEVRSVKVEWEVNDVAQPVELMTSKPGTNLTFELNKSIIGLKAGDKIEYRIRADDNSAAHNVSYTPSSTTFYEVNVVGLGDTREFYANNFDDLSTADFFGNGFTVSKPTGFANGAIHSDHPYAAAGAGEVLDLIYNLKVPIRIRRPEAILKFDEVVLVEPGETGVAWPNEGFFDYVVVEGSTDGGVTWVAIADGYDSQLVPAWKSVWDSAMSDDNSTAVGTPSLYRTHTFNLFDKFKAGDEVAFRFRLFSDAFSFGWGWAIDNLKIQIDDTPPSILHQHKDFVLTNATSMEINAKITDNSRLDQIFVDYNVNGGSTTTTEVLVDPTVDTYTQTIDLAALDLKAGDEFQYKIRATDTVGNSNTYPVSGFIKTAIISLTTSIDMLATDFQAPSADLTGNFFSPAQPNGFTSNGMTTSHPYDAGMGIDQTSDFAWMTKKPVKVSSDNPRIVFEDLAIVEYSGASVKDYVVVEASKDGIQWEPLIAPYAANAYTQWKTIFDTKLDGFQGAREKHMIDITSSGKFKAGDVILIRFRLHSDETGTGWGWFVDNLSIQGPITGLETALVERAFTAWPNPVSGGSLHLSINVPSETEVNVEILSTQGQVVTAERFLAPAGESGRNYDAAGWSPGFYVVKVRSDLGTTIQKIIKLR